MRMLRWIADDMPRKAAMILAVLAVTASMSSGGAFASTTYVSRSGLDANTCLTAAQACKTFQKAHDQAADGDTIVCLNAAEDNTQNFLGTGYGLVTITKAITIDCAFGGGVNSSLRVIINAPGKNVRLQNMILNYFNLGDMITISAATAVHLENVKVTGSINRCLIDQRTGPGKLTIVNSVFRDCGSVGILILPAGGSSLDVLLDNARSYGSGYGLAAGTGSKIAIMRSVFSGNSTAGVEGDSGSLITVDGSTVTSNGFGIQSSSSIRLSNNDIGFNTTAISGASFTFGNNRFSGNGSSGTALTAIGGATSDRAQQ